MGRTFAFLTGLLAAAVLVLGYLYYQEQRDDVEVKIDVPNVSVQTD